LQDSLQAAASERQTAPDTPALRNITASRHGSPSVPWAPAAPGTGLPAPQPLSAPWAANDRLRSPKLVRKPQLPAYATDQPRSPGKRSPKDATKRAWFLSGHCRAPCGKLHGFTLPGGKRNHVGPLQFSENNM